MGGYILRRLWTMVWTLLLVSALIFWIVNLPPGDVITNQIQQLRASGEASAVAKAEFLMKEYALDRPMWEQYLIWMGFWPGPNGFSGILQGDLGWSFELDQPVSGIVGEAIYMTIALNFFAILFVYVVALPLGAIAAVKANSWIDYLATFIGYIGLATPNFLLALILYHKGAQWFGLPVGGLMDPRFADQAMNWDKLSSILIHMIVPVIVIGTAGMAAMVRRLRANLLDELSKPYVTTAQAKGVGPVATVVKYPLRMALNPFVADIGNLLPSLVSGSVLVSLVMGLQTIGPILLSALRSQDYFLSGFILLFVSVLTLVGMLVSDLLLAVLDPRIRFSGEAPVTREHHYADHDAGDRHALGASGGDYDAHWVSDEAYDAEADLQELDRADLDLSTQALIWRRFRRHKLAMISGIYLLAIYLALPFVGFLAPYHHQTRDPDAIYAPPQNVDFFVDGHFMVTYPMTSEIDMETFQPVFTQDLNDPRPLRWFARCGRPWSILGVAETDLRLMCPPDGAPFYLLGADRLGRDMHSRIMHGAQLSLTVGLIGVFISFAIGMTLGGFAGYFGGWLDAVVQRSIEIIRSLPELPIWLAMSAAIPANWGPVAVFFMISIILGLLDWPGLARAVRSKFLALREEDYVRAAELMGASTTRIVGSHMMPNFMSHLVASATLSIPTMILGETALSLLGLGLRPPAVSWGLMLNDALDLTAVEIYPWLLTPMVPVIMVVLAFNFLGDGLRDALDPYS